MTTINRLTHFVLAALAGLTFLALVASSAQAVDEDDLLPVDVAFAATASFAAPDEIQVRWQIADGYYLYKSRLSFASNSPGVALGEPLLPKGAEYDDEFFGLQETYRQTLDVFLPVSAPAGQTIELQLKSQGCADLGVCYPPHSQTLTLSVPNNAAPAPGFSAGGTLSGNTPFNTSGGSFLAPDLALPVDQAFRFETIAVAGNALLARWTIADGYYLYRDQIEISLSDNPAATVAEVDLPPGEAKTDEHFGDTFVYYGQIEVPVTLSRKTADATSVTLQASYQGCKEAGICYPPVTKRLPLSLPAFSGPLGAAMAQTTADTSPVVVPEQDRLAQALGRDQFLTLLTFFGFGLLLSFTPCVFPMIPILSSIIAGQGDSITTRRAFTLSLIYVLAMALTYTAAGVVAGLFGENLQAWFQQTWVLATFAGLFILLSLSMFGFYELDLPSGLRQRISQISSRQEGGTFIGTAIMGVLSALIVGPCVAPPLAAALIYIGQTGDAFLGGLALFSLGLGMGVPLLVIGTSAGRLLPHAGPWMEAIKAVFGVGLLALAIWMLERILAPGWIMLAWGCLAVSSGVYLGAFEKLRPEQGGWFRLWKSLGVLLVMLGALQLVGAAAGGRDWLQPLKGVFGGAPSGQQNVSFTPIKSLADLNQQLATSAQPVMLDFYADWCVDCKRMDKYTFPTAPVSNALAAGLSLKADVTANDAVDQELMRAFNIIGPPAILFFDATGQELPQYRVVGYQRPEAFARHVSAAFATTGQQP